MGIFAFRWGDRHSIGTVERSSLSKKTSSRPLSNLTTYRYSFAKSYLWITMPVSGRRRLLDGKRSHTLSPTENRGNLLDMVWENPYLPTLLRLSGEGLQAISTNLRSAK